jgi:hypothetical protein
MSNHKEGYPPSSQAAETILFILQHCRTMDHPEHSLIQKKANCLGRALKEQHFLI